MHDVSLINAGKYTQRLAEALEKRDNVEIIYGKEVEGFVFDKTEKIVTGVRITGRQDILGATAVVLCPGPLAAPMLKKHFGLSCPVMPIKGYSFDFISDYDHNHKHHIIFKNHALVLSFMADKRVRVAGLGDVHGANWEVDEKRLAYMTKLVEGYFSKEEVPVSQKRTKPTACLRPCSPDDMPIVGGLHLFPNVYVNVGHSARGVTTATATGKMVAEQIGRGRIECMRDTGFLSPRRFGL